MPQPIARRLLPISVKIFLAVTLEIERLCAGRGAKANGTARAVAKTGARRTERKPEAGSGARV